MPNRRSKKYLPEHDHHDDGGGFREFLFQPIIKRIHAVQHQLEFIQGLGEKIMASQDEFNAVLGRIDTATNEIAADISGLRDQIAGLGLPSTVEADILAQLDAAASRLEGIGADNANPVPDPVPDPVPTPDPAPDA